jgi:hypothetical protein
MRLSVLDEDHLAHLPRHAVLDFQKHFHAEIFVKGFHLQSLGARAATLEGIRLFALRWPTRDAVVPPEKAFWSASSEVLVEEAEASIALPADAIV